MINYLKSEHYRLRRKKSLHLTSVICLLLISVTAAVLYFSQPYEPNYPYATGMVLYANLISGGILIIIVAFLFNLALTGKDAAVIKQSVSFGISRHTIFWSKLILTLSYFLLLCVIGLFLTVMLGETLLVSEELSVRNFLIASSNMVPIVLSGFFMIHMLRMLKANEIYIIIILVFIFIFSGDLLRMLLQSISGLNELYQYAPSTLLSENVIGFVNQAAQFDLRYWFVGSVISLISLVIGAKMFAKQNID